MPTFSRVRIPCYAWDILFIRASKGHVARGAVLVRACAPFIVRRPILRSKAVTTLLEVTDEIRESPIYSSLYIQKDPYEGKEWYHAAQWLAKQVFLKENVRIFSETDKNLGDRSQGQTCQWYARGRVWGILRWCKETLLWYKYCRSRISWDYTHFRSFPSYQWEVGSSTRG